MTTLDWAFFLFLAVILLILMPWQAIGRVLHDASEGCAPILLTLLVIVMLISASGFCLALHAAITIWFLRAIGVTR